MRAFDSELPCLDSLQEGLASAFEDTEFSRREFTVLARKRNPYSSTFPAEIVTCSFADGRKLRLHCKYEAGRGDGVAGHRRGLGYEASVYSDVLRPVDAGVPRFYGAHCDGAKGEMWLILEYLDRTLAAHKTASPAGSLLSASRWIGQFHARAGKLLWRDFPPFLMVHTEGFYTRWARRTALLARRLGDQFQWLALVSKRFEALVPALVAGGNTVIHGEFYPQNILARAGKVYPVDWQSAAVAAGEIDLASLTSGRWPSRLVRECEAEYARARWPEGAPSDFGARVAMARAYWALRFLGDDPEAGLLYRNRGYLSALQSASKQLGLI